MVPSGGGPKLNSPVITLTTDFGTVDPYVAMMKGVILGINPRVSIVDISHHIPAQAVLQGAFVLGNSHRYFPKGTIHVVVVDPGVGTSRAALLMVTPSAYFLGPDNGVFSYILEEGLQQGHPMEERVLLPEGYEAYQLTNAEYWVQPVSSTFHGRDIFAPAAAHLSLGVPPHRLAQQVQRVTYFKNERHHWEGDTLVGQVVHIDHFGNLVTNIPESLLPNGSNLIVEVCGQTIRSLNTSYAESDGLLAIVGSYKTLEVAVRNGNAAEELHAKVGEAVRAGTSTTVPGNL